MSLRIASLTPTQQALGAALHYVGRHPPFADFRAQDLIHTLAEHWPVIIPDLGGSATYGNDDALDAIAEASGFRSQETLRHHFRARTGVSPSAFRRSFGRIAAE